MRDDANEIAPGLWQGRRPPTGWSLRQRGFDALVLMADTYQPPSDAFPGVKVHHAPIQDRLKFSGPDWEKVKGAALFTARQLRAGRKVLVTCEAGINRSGMVSALALCLYHGMPGSVAIRRVQDGRPGALFNPTFRKVVRRACPAGAA